MLETFDKKTTNWAGLWWHPEYNCFSSAAINLSKLKDFKGSVRLYVKKNKYYNNGENGRPNYHFCLKDANSNSARILEIEDDDDVEDDDEEYLYSREEVEMVKRGACLDGQRGYEPGDLLIEDYILR